MTVLADRLSSRRSGLSGNGTRGAAGQAISGGTYGLAKTESSQLHSPPGIWMISLSGTALAGVVVGVNVRCSGVEDFGGTYGLVEVLSWQLCSPLGIMIIFVISITVDLVDVLGTQSAM